MSLKEEGNDAVKANDFALAVQKYSDALGASPSDHTIYSNRSYAHQKLGDGKKALDDAEDCIALKGDFAKGWLRKGQAHELLGQYRNAVEAYRSGLDMDPASAPLKAAYKDADAKERAAPPSPSPAPAPAPAPAARARAPAPAPASRENQVQKTREERQDALMEVDLPKIFVNFAKVHWMCAYLSSSPVAVLGHAVAASCQLQTWAPDLAQLCAQSCRSGLWAF